MITLGRRGDLHARRQATAFLRSRDVVHKLFAEVAPRFKDRPGGYARIIRIGPRAGDAAEMVYLELVDEEYVATQREERTPAPAPAVAVPAEAPRPGDEEPSRPERLQTSPRSRRRGEPTRGRHGETEPEATSLRRRRRRGR